MSKFRLYSRDWLHCSACGRETLDGHFTCGWAARSEAEQQVARMPRSLACLAYLDDCRLCGELATPVDPKRMIMVCPEDAPEEWRAVHG